MQKRALEMRVVKRDKRKDIVTHEAEITLEGKADIVSYHVQKILAKIGTGVIVYVLADTARKVILAKAVNGS